MDLATLLAREHGVARANYLIHNGIDRAEIHRCVRAGSLRRLRRGWYASAHAEPTVVSAVAAGGVLGCVSALQVHGVWVPASSRVHVRLAGGSRGARCSYTGRPLPMRRSVDDPATALRHAVHCLEREGVIVVCDSLLHLGMMTRADLAGELRSAPLRIRRLVDRCDRAESGTESMVRVRLRARGVAVAPQVWIPGVGRVDLLVGSRLILEVDGERFHSSADAFDSDRARDRRAARLGYLVIRLSYRQVVFGWEQVERDILDIVRRREHRRSLPAS